ncbi:MAG TPA: hypothetical protein VL727_14875 [Puia sp.]|nr:hypothetical protein [Puia sp.]
MSAKGLTAGNEHSTFNEYRDMMVSALKEYNQAHNLGYSDDQLNELAFAGTFGSTQFKAYIQGLATKKRIRTMKIVCIIALSFFPAALIAQRSQVFRFVVADRVIVDSSAGLYAGKSYEYTYKRVFCRDSCFKEVGLFAGGNDECFRISNGIWYIERGKKWELFYSPHKKASPKIRMGDQSYNLRFRQHQNLNGIECMVYDAIPVNATVSGSIQYWFSPRNGIVQIKTDEVTLIREDLRVTNAANTDSLVGGGYLLWADNNKALSLSQMADGQLQLLNRSWLMIVISYPL